MSIRFMSAIWDSSLYDGPRLLMMLALADYADDGGWGWPGYATLAKKIRRDEKTVYRILSVLETEGAIRRKDNRIGICEPSILEEVKRRAEANQEHEPEQDKPRSQPRREKTTAKQPPSPLNSENGILRNENLILNSENEILNSENEILNSENEILNSETPYNIEPW